MDAATASKKFQQSKVLFASGDYFNSLGLLDEVDLAFPNQKNIMYARGMCLKNLGRKDEAIAVCQSALSYFEDAKITALLEELQRMQPPLALNLSDLLPPEIQMAPPLTSQGGVAPARSPFGVPASSAFAPVPPPPTSQSPASHMAPPHSMPGVFPAGSPPPIAPTPQSAFNAAVAPPPLAVPDTAPAVPGPPPLATLSGTAFSFDDPGFATQTSAAPSYAAPQSNKRYIIIGSVVGVVLLLLIGFPIVRGLTKGDEASGVQTVAGGEAAQTAVPASPDAATSEMPTQSAALTAAPDQIGWYHSFDEGMQIAQQYDRMAFVFITDESEAARQVEQTSLMDEEVRRQSTNFICIRAKYDPNADPDTQEIYLEYVESPPAIQIYSPSGFVLSEVGGEELTAENLAFEMSALTTFIQELESFELPTGKLIFVTIVALLMMPWPLFLALFFTGKLPHDGFVNNYISVGGTAIVVALRIGSLIGIARAIVMLKDIYDMSVVDLFIFAALYVFYLLSYVVFMTLVLGHSVVEQLMTV